MPQGDALKHAQTRPPRYSTRRSAQRRDERPIDRDAAMPVDTGRMSAGIGLRDRDAQLTVMED